MKKLFGITNIFFWCDLPHLAVFIIIVNFLPSSGPTFPSSFYEKPGFEPTSKDHGLDRESSAFTIRPGGFPTKIIFNSIWENERVGK